MRRLISFFAGLCICLAETEAANIAWVSFHSGDNTPSTAAAGAGFTQAPDIGYTDLLKSQGHTVTRYLTTATPDTNLLNSFDLVIISRSVPSGNYQTPESTALWNGLTKPTMILGGYIIRGSRLGYTIGDTIPDTAGDIRLEAKEPAHPIFTGVALDAANVMENVFAGIVTFNNVAQRGISVNTDEVAPGATVLATVATDTDPAFGGMIIGEYPAGTVMGNASADTAAAKRMVFLTGSREQGITSEGAGLFDLKADGARLFLNAVSYMTGAPVTEPPPIVSVIRPVSGTVNFFAPQGLSFTASSAALGGIAATNISLVLNGTNVSADLVIGGTPAERTISYTNLAPNVNYTGVITVRDAGAREATVNISFDTQTPFVLPAAWAYAPGSGVEAAGGFKARFAQAYDTATLASSADRAEAQLAGTLIDSTTTTPFTNDATPSTDNPDGSYNVPLINWSVETGIAERGNFQAPQFPDERFPAITHDVNFAAEILTYLELQPGRYVMGVNSDDGFVVYSGAHPRDAFAVALGRFEGARGSADTIFQFEVAQAGLYPFRLVYYQGTGGANLEWFTADPITGEKVLINDRTNPKAVRAWRQIQPAERPYVASVSPGLNAINVLTEAPVTLVLQDGGSAVNTNSVQLTLNGQSVQPSITKAGGATTVSYAPGAGLQSDSPYRASLTFADNSGNTRTVSFDFHTRFVPPTQKGAKIAWVSFHNADEEPSAGAVGNGFTEAPDIGYTRLLKEAGHQVTRYLTTATPDVDLLNTFDLVIVSRSNPSGNFQSEDSTTLWHGIQKPTIQLGGYLLRGSRLGFTSGDTIPDVTATNIVLTVNNPSHPIFAGVPLNGSNTMVNPYAHLVTYNGTVQRGISVNTSPITPGGTVLATVGTAGDPAFGGMIIAEFPAGTQMSNSAANTNAAKSLVFLTGSREQGISAEAAGLYDLDSDGAKLFLNAVRYMAGLDTVNPSPAALAINLAGAGEITIAWPASASDSFRLQSSSSLATGSWQDVPGTPASAGGSKTVTLSPTAKAQFFRLIGQ